MTIILRNLLNISLIVFPQHILFFFSKSKCKTFPQKILDPSGLCSQHPLQRSLMEQSVILSKSSLRSDPNTCLARLTAAATKPCHLLQLADTLSRP